MVSIGTHGGHGKSYRFGGGKVGENMVTAEENIVVSPARAAVLYTRRSWYQIGWGQCPQVTAASTEKVGSVS